MADESSNILDHQKKFFASGKTRSVDFRIEQLKNLKAVIRAREDELMNALREDMNKPSFESYASEIGFLYMEIEHSIRNVGLWARARRVPTPIIHFLSSSMIYREPYGSALIIGPWNYPAMLVIAPLVGSMAAGNCAIVKPSEMAPATSSALRRMIESAFDPHYLAVIEGGADVTQNLLAQKFDYIFFTGGTAIGRIVMEAAAKNLVPVTLELGGKSPCIIDRETNLKYTAKRIAWGKFFNAGQTCLAPDYCLVHKAIKEDFVSEMKNTLRSFYGEDASKSPDYARIVNERHFQRLQKLMDGGRIVFGGRVDAASRYIEPTLFDNVTLQDKIMKEEIFGPLLPVMSYENLDEAIALTNSMPHPLALYYFSDNKENQEKAIREIRAGGGCINDTLSHIGSQHLPFGGLGDSGLGEYHGRFGFETFTHRKSILKRSNKFDMFLRYPPYKNNVKILKALFKIIG